MNVRSKYKQLVKLIQRLPREQSEIALAEARTKMRNGRAETNPEKQLSGMKELAARIGYLRMVTPRLPGDVTAEAGIFVLNRDGELVESQGGESTSRYINTHTHTHTTRVFACDQKFNASTFDT